MSDNQTLLLALAVLIGIPLAGFLIAGGIGFLLAIIIVICMWIENKLDRR